MLKSVLAVSAVLAMVGGAVAADLPTAEPAPVVVAPVGKAPIGKAPIGKEPVAGPIVTKG